MIVVILVKKIDSKFDGALDAKEIYIVIAQIIYRVITHPTIN